MTCLQVVKEREQLAGIDKQKETLMASKILTISQHHHLTRVTSHHSDISIVEEQENVDQ